MTHDEIWAAIDALAARHGMSVSRLAREAGLDPTTFNKSKRVSADERLRWPSTESVAKVLRATGSSLSQMMGFDDDTDPVRVPLIGFAQAGEGACFDETGFPIGDDLHEVEMPTSSGRRAYALEISGESMEPLYRDGDVIIVDPDSDPRRGDRVVVRTTDGQVVAKVLTRETAGGIELHSVNPEHPDLSFARSEVDWMARIVWASQ